MVTTENKEILKTIKEAVLNNPLLDMIIHVSPFAKIDYSSKKQFGDKVLELLSREKTETIIFNGIKDNALVFTVKNSIGEDIWKNRGYGRGQNMGD